MRNVVLVEVLQSTEGLAHDHGSFFLCQRLPLDHKIEELPSLAVATSAFIFGLGHLLSNEETDVLPLPDFIELDDVRMILIIKGRAKVSNRNNS